MKKTFETKFGEISLKNVMIDTDGTNLADGIEIRLEGVLIGETTDIKFHFDDEDVDIKDVEAFVEKHCDPRDF